MVPPIYGNPHLNRIFHEIDKNFTNQLLRGPICGTVEPPSPHTRTATWHRHHRSLDPVKLGGPLAMLNLNDKVRSHFQINQSINQSINQAESWSLKTLQIFILSEIHPWLCCSCCRSQDLSQPSRWRVAVARGRASPLERHWFGAEGRCGGLRPLDLRGRNDAKRCEADAKRLSYRMGPPR